MPGTVQQGAQPGAFQGNAFQSSAFQVAKPGVVRRRDPNPGAERRPKSSQIVGGLISVEIVVADAVGRARIRSTADGAAIAQAAPTPLLPVKAPRTANQPQLARLRSRFATPIAAVEAQISGFVRVRGTADGDSIPQAMRPLASRANQPAAARLRSRFATPIAAVEAQAVGRARVRSTADGDPIPQAMRAVQ